MPVQWVNRPNQDFRGFAGMIASGVVKKGDRVKALPSGKESRVMRIVTQDGDYDRGITGQSVTLTIEHEIDVSRGDVWLRRTRRQAWRTSFESPSSGCTKSPCSLDALIF
jgi:bifunctional enzyme CysN/CysC